MCLIFVSNVKIVGKCVWHKIIDAVCDKSNSLYRFSLLLNAVFFYTGCWYIMWCSHKQMNFPDHILETPVWKPTNYGNSYESIINIVTSAESTAYIFRQRNAVNEKRPCFKTRLVFDFRNCTIVIIICSCSKSSCVLVIYYFVWILY